MKYGFVEPQDDETAYVLGGLTKLPKTISQPNGNWTPYLPIYEPQAENYETWGCTVWGTQNAIEILFKKLFGTEPNYAERFNYIRVQIREPGTDPHKTCESVRKDGLINAEILPVTPTYEEFIEPDPLPGSILAKGQYWLTRYKFLHEWVFQNLQSPEEQTKLIRECLTYSPLGVSVTAWNEENGVYVDNGQPNNHWCVLFNEVSNGWEIFDSYDHSIKVIPFTHKIRFCKRFYIEARPKMNWFQSILYALFS